MRSSAELLKRLWTTRQAIRPGRRSLLNIGRKTIYRKLEQYNGQDPTLDSAKEK